MKRKLKRLLVRILEIIYRLSPASERIARIEQSLNRSGNGMQVLLSLHYKELLRQGAALPKFDDVEFRAFSQNGEDGILLYLFSLIATTNKRAVEICAGDGIQCNTANLIVNHGWNALLIDGDEGNVNCGGAFYKQCPDTMVWPPKFIHAWITAENVNSLVSDNGFTGDIDLLSLDMDGVDYWIWDALTVIKPRVVVLEYNNIWGPDVSVTVPYNPEFRTEYNQWGCDYSGASLAAFVKLGRKKGYRLVGCQRYGFNAFFVRSDINPEIFPEVPASSCFGHPFAQFSMSNRLSTVIDREWVKI
jgi:hypothetical protein